MPSPEIVACLVATLNVAWDMFFPTLNYLTLPHAAAATSSTAGTPATVNHLFIRFPAHSTLKT